MTIGKSINPQVAPYFRQVGPAEKNSTDVQRPGTDIHH